MGVVGGIENAILAKKSNRKGQRFLIRVARKEELLAPGVLAWQPLYGPCLPTKDLQHHLVLVIEPFNKMGDPPHPRLHKGPAQFRKAIKDTSENELSETDHIGHRNQSKCQAKVPVDDPLQVVRVALERDVDTDGDVEPLTLFVQWI